MLRGFEQDGPAKLDAMIGIMDIMMPLSILVDYHVENPRGDVESDKAVLQITLQIGLAIHPLCERFFVY